MPELLGLEHALTRSQQRIDIMKKTYSICMLLATISLLAVLVFQFLELRALFVF